ncbi:MAG: hypothetical protein ACKKMS_02545 [Candidatus Nealsonbacteria bacterium]
MAKERLSILQKAIITTLRALDEVEYKTNKKLFKKKAKQPPYWHKLRKTTGDGSMVGSGWITDRGLKFYVEKCLKAHYKLPELDFSNLDKVNAQEEERMKHPKYNYFDHKPTGKVSQRLGYNIYRSSSFDISFSRSLKSLWEKKFIECDFIKNWRNKVAQIRTIKLTEKGLNVKM